MLTPALSALAEEHIYNLACRYRIQVFYSKEWDTSEANIEHRQVFIPKRFTRGIDYLAALHEFGHIIDRTARRRDTASYKRTCKKDRHADDIICEAAAWAWAVKEANPKILRGFNAADWRKVGQAWSGYVVR